MKKFYTTTAIDYVNGAPHIGHAYEKILTDVIFRHFAQRCDNAFMLTDTDNNVSFTFEPNEMANLVSYPIVFMRKKTDSKNLEPAGRTLSLSLAWDVNLSCGMEMEKTINLSIIPGRKKSRTS